MKLIHVNTSDPNEYGEDYGVVGARLKTETYSGSATFGSGEPEDMILGRDLNDAYSIGEMIKAAYEAGVRGEPLEEYTQGPEDETR